MTSEMPHTAAHAKAETSSLGDLLGEVTRDMSTLMRQEVELAKVELKQSATRAGKGAGMLAGAGVTALLGLGALTAVLIIALDSFLPLWLAALIVTLVWFAIAAALAVSGKAALQSATPPVPQTVETLKEDIQWAKTRT